LFDFPTPISREKANFMAVQSWHCKRNKALANLLFVRPDAKRTTMLIRSFSRFALYLALMLSLSATSGSAQTGGLSWRTFEVPESGTRVDYPSGMFMPSGAPKKGVGKEFERTDGRAVLSVYSLDNQAGDIELLGQRSAHLEHKMLMC
jgi:hypothetical protein